MMQGAHALQYTRAHLQGLLLLLLICVCGIAASAEVLQERLQLIVTLLRHCSTPKQWTVTYSFSLLPSAAAVPADITSAPCAAGMGAGRLTLDNPNQL